MLKQGFSRLLSSSQTCHSSTKAASLPLFLLPTWSRSFNATSQIVDGNSITEPLGASSSAPDALVSSQIARAAPPTIRATVTTSHPASDGIDSAAPSSLDTQETLKALLPLLRAQAPHYITILIHNRPYLVTAGDTIRLPFYMPDVVPGDILRLTRALNLGSRDFTLKGAPYVDEHLFECRARVMGVEAEPMRIKEKTKRRQRKVKTVRSKHKYTILKIAEVSVVEGEGTIL